MPKVRAVKPKMPETMYVVRSTYGAYSIIAKLDDLGANQIAGVYRLEGIKQKKVRHELVDLMFGEGEAREGENTDA